MGATSASSSGALSNRSPDVGAGAVVFCATATRGVKKSERSSDSRITHNAIWTSRRAVGTHDRSSKRSQPSLWAQRHRGHGPSALMLVNSSVLGVAAADGRLAEVPTVPENRVMLNAGSTYQ